MGLAPGMPAPSEAPPPPLAAPPPPADPVARWLEYPTVKRALRLALAVSVLVLFRRLLPLLVFFVAFERTLGALAAQLAQRSGLGRRAALAVVALLVLALLGLAVALGAGRALHAALALRGALPERIAAFRDTDLYRQVQERLHGAGSLVEGAQHYASSALEYLAALGHLVLYAVVGFILAVVYLLEHEELAAWAAARPPDSTFGVLLRWSGHLADAVSVTLQFQVVVAAVNAALTFPVLLLVGIPHPTTFLFMVFFSGMVPVVGNFVAGATLTLLAYQARGVAGAIILSVLTFVLHKLESYYLNPRLAARHVRLPGFVLIVSLLLWEQLVGFAGLFISFPFLFIANRIQAEFRAEDERAGR